MYDSGPPTADAEAARLFRASHLSFDPSTADFSLRRVVPISILVEGDPDRVSEVAEQFRKGLEGVMEEAGYPAVDGTWGPFPGSWFITIFGKGNHPETGPSFHQKVQRIADRVLMYARTHRRELLAGIRIVILVGNLVVSIAGAGAVAAVLPAMIPVQVIECVHYVAEAADVVWEICHALGVKKESSG